MTATTSSFGSWRGRAEHLRIGALARAAGSLLKAIRSRWSDIVDSGQLGPNTETLTSRHTGGRI